MPEVVTRYPTLLLNELKDAGGKCGEGLPQNILKSCPKDKFCVLPSGEICVYDLHDATTMTQISPADWAEEIKGVPGMFGYSNLIVLVFIFGLGVVIGLALKDRERTLRSHKKKLKKKK